MLNKLSKEEQISIKNARILYYDFFYGFFVFEVLGDRAKVAKKQINILKQSSLNEVVEADFLLLENEINQNGMENIKEEFSRLFALPFGGKQVGMHLSHYYEGCVGGDSLLKMRGIVKKSDIRVNSKEFKETEEHLGFLFGFMRYLVENDDETLAKEVFLYVNQAFFQLVKEINEREDSKYYLALARILESFLKFEEEIYT
ncbi:MAG: molecular chaperone TorD family protein [Helicobacter sp.]|uniref:Molecular chaperone TorD family protein n=1 Tax=Helicobacter colisuis TaxID=2949739 RepID=A0ABT0TRQ9_9HELI|nr:MULTISPECIES: molecular chaperone TorD family protein [Helicobacter]MCI2236175.1 molecular chaperone TorD family protein [Helicobacter sp. CaF467b]MCL9818599.1 molecular chaperone TorD family protein [Helicobacter colisuis]MDY4425863.1 molecular chaperone TorD family protein [Helicobacter sp.]